MTWGLREWGAIGGAFGVGLVGGAVGEKYFGSPDVKTETKIIDSSAAEYDWHTMLARLAQEQVEKDSHREEKVRIVEVIKRVPVPCGTGTGIEETITREETRGTIEDKDSHRTSTTDTHVDDAGKATETTAHEAVTVTTPAAHNWRLGLAAGWDSAHLEWRPELTAYGAVRVLGPLHLWLEVAPPVVNLSTRMAGGLSAEVEW